MGVSIPLKFGTKKSEPHRHRIELETPHGAPVSLPANAVPIHPGRRRPRA